MSKGSFVREALVAIAFAFGAWLVIAALTSLAFWLASPRLAYAVQIVLAPPVGVAMSLGYFQRSNALRPLLAAIVVGLVALLSSTMLDQLFERRAEGLLGAVISTWFPVALLAITTFMVGLGSGQPPRRTNVESSSS